MSIFKADDIFSDGMILQRDTENFITGDGEGEITLTLERDERICGRSRIAADGRWRIAVPAGKADSLPYTINIRCGNLMIVISDVLFGDVFHITGQSNMELPMSRTYDPFKGKVAVPEEDLIREYRVPIDLCFEAGKESHKFIGGSWKRACDDTDLSMSAAGYFFAKNLFAETGVPVGLVNTSAGGSAIEGRIPAEVCREFPELDPVTDMVTAKGYMEKTLAEGEKNQNSWSSFVNDNDKLAEDILAGKFPAGNKVNIPFWVDEVPALSGFTGRLWLWKTFEVPANADLSDPMLILGTLVDADVCYINGTRVGSTDYLYPPRYYSFPADILKKGKNTLAVRLDIMGAERGGFTEGKRFCVKLGDTVIDLSGQWDYEIAVKAEKRGPVEFLPSKELAVYGFMTAPAYRLPFKGMLVYQGETNCGGWAIYDKLYKRFVEYYRQRCGYDIPVVSVQLPNWTPGGETWVHLRQKQLECCAIPNTAMAVTLGMGENNDLHPKNKAAVGAALCDCVLRLIYNKGDTRPVSPVSVKQSKSGIQLDFPEEVRLTDPETDYFEVHTKSGWHTAPASEKDGGINLSISGTADKVRYAWRPDADNPAAKGVSGRLVPTFEMTI
ncbi:sialate O-acetylesterase [Ruminococcus sp.]|uniref:sialate O-acetylesterase n=1 Tax=Ruminococcus sp. TaxID=41978 RepID=UPI0025DF5BF7|nr:sialate O-acetylesterase [Ruminococcus sp.]MBQ8965693.1 sialate O-acetylesterase [Ruminococcus sp.]